MEIKSSACEKIFFLYYNKPLNENVYEFILFENFRIRFLELKMSIF